MCSLSHIRRAATNGRLTVDLYEEARRLTLDIVLRCVLSVSYAGRPERRTDGACPYPLPGE